MTFGHTVINYSEKNGILTFRVQVVARASRSEIVGEHDGALRVRIAAPPVDGAANDELVRLLARALGLPRRAITITGGHTSKLKVIGGTGLSPAALAALVDGDHS
jgi:uncharacterized protein (TIGR00251 family)